MKVRGRRPGEPVGGARQLDDAVVEIGPYDVKPPVVGAPGAIVDGHQLLVVHAAHVDLGVLGEIHAAVGGDVHGQPVAVDGDIVELAVRRTEIHVRIAVVDVPGDRRQRSAVHPGGSSIGGVAEAAEAVVGGIGVMLGIVPAGAQTPVGGAHRDGSLALGGGGACIAGGVIHQPIGGGSGRYEGAGVAGADRSGVDAALHCHTLHQADGEQPLSARVAQGGAVDVCGVAPAARGRIVDDHHLARHRFFPCGAAGEAAEQGQHYHQGKAQAPDKFVHGRSPSRKKENR